MYIEIDRHYQFLTKYFKKEDIYQRFENIFIQLESIINEMGVSSKVRIDEALLQQSVLDYFTDIARIKHFHEIKVNEPKIYSYGIFWLLRRSPIQLKEPVDEVYTYINEKAAISILFTKMLKELGVDVSKNDKRIISMIDNYIDLLYYNFKFRLYTQQSLELMIAAFFCGSICYCEVEKNDVC